MDSGPLFTAVTRPVGGAHFPRSDWIQAREEDTLQIFRLILGWLRSVQQRHLREQAIDKGRWSSHGQPIKGGPVSLRHQRTQRQLRESAQASEVQSKPRTRRIPKPTILDFGLPGRDQTRRQRVERAALEKAGRMKLSLAVLAAALALSATDAFGVGRPLRSKVCQTRLWRFPMSQSPPFSHRIPFVLWLSQSASQTPSALHLFGLFQREAKQTTGTSFLSEETLERAKQGNKFEKVKLEKDGTAAWTEMSEFAQAIREGKTSWEEIAGDDIDIRLKWAGLFHRRKATPGRFMIRFKIANGIVSSECLRFYAESIEPYGNDLGVLDITTRMNVQLRGMPLEAAADISKRAYELGQSTLMSGMDNVRNLVGSPIAGVDPLELIDTRPICKGINDMITDERKGNPEWTNLPRKFNIAVSGSYDDFAHTHINDIGLVPVAHAETGEVGFNVIMGGYFSIKRAAMSVPLNLWIPPEQAVNLSKATLRIFRDEGERGDRQKARLMWLIEKYGVDAWREALIKEMKSYDKKFVEQPEQPEPVSQERRDILGVHPQKDPAFCWVGVAVPVGRLYADELYKLADLADEYGDGEVRLTVEQNVIFANVPKGRVDELVEKINAIPRLTVNPGKLMRSAVSCTGAQFCPVAISETKNVVTDVLPVLEERLEIPQNVRIHWTGCPNSCGQAQVVSESQAARLFGVDVNRSEITLGLASFRVAS
eukprot:scaffold778_cov263-Pinguiococcus_pyrenoidosus.AAC.17